MSCRLERILATLEDMIHDFPLYDPQVSRATAPVKLSLQNIF